MQKTNALILGVVLAIVGIWGLFAETIIVFGVNIAQSILHLIAAAAGIYAGTKGDGMSFNMIIGYIGVVLGIIGFIPGIKDVLANLLNINTATSVLHLIIGALCLGVYYTHRK